MDTNAFWAYAGEADKSIERVIFETEIRCKDGTIKHAAWRGQWSISEKTLFCIVHDTTEQKQVEQALRTSEAQLKDILESLPAGVLITTDSYTVEFANAASRRLLARSETNIIGQPVESLMTKDFPNIFLAWKKNDRIAARADGSFLPVETHTEEIALGGKTSNCCCLSTKVRSMTWNEQNKNSLRWLHTICARLLLPCATWWF